jgi:predicted enzyme related to lactoylglutathione lyase
MPPAPKKASRAPSPKAPSPWVASTAVVVKNNRAALRWYNEVLGLPTAMDGDHWITVGSPKKGAALHLCQADENHPPIPMEPGNTGILLLLDGDFHAQCEALKGRGVKFVDGPTERPWGWDATIQDPDGNEILLMPSD